MEWQRGLNAISATKGTRFFQVDFSATPFDTKGTGDNQVKLYFPHIIVDFDLTMAMKQGLVKLLLLDRRQELTELENLDYNAERDEQGKVVGLSEGQRMMLRAGLTKLSRLEEEFLKVDPSKNPKMLIVCQDTTVSPFVEEFLKSEGLEDENIVTIDSNKQGEVKDEEWQEIKKKLFDIDRYKSPKVVVSVLMLREGFDVNNICVLVPLRSSQAPILLEQLVGRGLRLMWREPDYLDIKRDDRLRVLKFHQPPKTYIDTLSIVEHPAFIKFYDDLQEQGLVAVDEGDVGGGGAAGDILTVGLREDYEDYDFQWPVILHDSIDELEDSEIDLNDLQPFTMYPLDLLRKFLAREGETFVSQESLTKTMFGKYKVTANLFNANGYNEYLQKLLRVVTLRFETCRRQGFPTIQINGAQTVQVMDWYIRTKLFAIPFNPFHKSDWKILLAKDGIVTKHIVEQFAVAIYKMQNRLTTIAAEVSHTAFSTLRAIKMRESFSMDVHKCIYPRLPVSGDVILNYSMDKSIYFATLNQYKYHPAIVISAEPGTEVWCAAQGKVTQIKVDEETGTTLSMDLGSGYEAVYGQLKELAVKEGDMVNTGALLGYVSEPTKYYTLEGSNLYFQLLRDGEPVNPMNYLE